MSLISEHDRHLIRSLPAFRRAVWGLRLEAVGVLLIAMAAATGYALHRAGVTPAGALVVAAPAVLALLAGMGLLGSAFWPLEKGKNRILEPYRLDPLARGTLMIRLILRDVVRRRRAASRR